MLISSNIYKESFVTSSSLVAPDYFLTLVYRGVAGGQSAGIQQSSTLISPRFALPESRCLIMDIYTIGNIKVLLLNSRTGQRHEVLHIINTKTAPKITDLFWAVTTFDLQHTNASEPEDEYIMEIEVFGQLASSLHLMTFRQILLLNYSCSMHGELNVGEYPAVCECVNY